MEKYEKPVLEIIALMNDVVTASGCDQESPELP
jgi:hypothetical protein